MTVSNNIFMNLPNDLKEECFEEIIGSKNISIERIVSKGHASPEEGWHDQERDEWVLLLKGQARLLYSSGEELEMNAGDYVSIPSHKKHKVLWTDPTVESIWLAIHY